MVTSQNLALGSLALVAGASLYVVATRKTATQSAPNRAVQQPKQQRQQSTTSSSGGGGGAKQAPDPKYIGDGENDEVGINDMSPDEETSEETTEETSEETDG